MEHGFIYQLADGVIGVLFVDGTHYIKTPDNKWVFATIIGNNSPKWTVPNKLPPISIFFRNYHKEPHADYFSSKQQNMDPHRLQVFEKFQEKLEQHGQFIPWTEFSRSKMVPLYTWFQTKEAMVMLLSNGTLQVIIDFVVVISHHVLKIHSNMSSSSSLLIIVRSTSRTTRKCWSIWNRKWSHSPPGN